MTFVACLVFMHDSVEIMVTQQAFLLKNYWKCDLPVNSSLKDTGIFFSGIDRGNVRGISSLIELATFFCLLQHLWSNINIGLNNIQQIIIKFDQI